MLACPPDKLRVSLLNRVLEDFAGAELGLRAGLDLHLLAGARIASDRGLATGQREIAEAPQPHLVAALQRQRDRLEHGLDRSACIVAAQSRAIGDMADEFLLVHSQIAPSCAAGLGPHTHAS